MLRIIAGERRGAKLRTLESNTTRPLRDRVRESLFNIIRPEIPDARVLDVFAGSGAVGLEALSRGARHATFVESSPQAQRVILDNTAKLRYEDRVTLIGRKIPGALAVVEDGQSLIFLMPPYESRLELKALCEIHECGIAAPEALAIVEVETAIMWPGDSGIDPWHVTDERTYGVTRLVFLRYLPSS